MTAFLPIVVAISSPPPEIRAQERIAIFVIGAGLFRITDQARKRGGAKVKKKDIKKMVKNRGWLKNIGFLMNKIGNGNQTVIFGAFKFTGDGQQKFDKGVHAGFWPAAKLEMAKLA